MAKYKIIRYDGVINSEKDDTQEKVNKELSEGNISEIVDIRSFDYQTIFIITILVKID